VSYKHSGSNEKVYYPNSILASKPISNYNRSPDQWDAIDFQIHATTPVEKIGILKEQMGKYIESLPQFWYPTFRLLCKDIEDSNRMKMSLWMQHHLNFQVQLLNTQPHNSNLLCNNLYNKDSCVCVSESFIPTYKPTLLSYKPTLSLPTSLKKEWRGWTDTHPWLISDNINPNNWLKIPQKKVLDACSL
jgi:hypothetical protein